MAGRLPGSVRAKPGAGSAGKGGLIDARPPRVLFSELVAGALERTRVEPSSLATAYLVDLLEENVRPASPVRGADAREETLAEGLLRARLQRGTARIGRLRRLGDRALFVAGYFGDWLEGRVVGLAYYRDAGRLAYAGVSTALRGRVRPQPAPDGLAPVPELFEELADRFPEFVEVLTEVGDSSRANAPEGLNGLFARFLRTAAERDRRRLVRRGHAVPHSTPRAQ